VESYRSCEHTFRCIADQALRYTSPEERAALQEADLEKRKIDPYNVLDSELLPFTVNVFFQQKSTAEGSQMHSTTSFLQTVNKNESEIADTDEYGLSSVFPRDKERPICNLYNSRLVVTVDWKTGDRELPIEDDISYTEALSLSLSLQKHSGRKSGMNSASITLRECLSAFTKEEELDEGAWYCGNCKQHQKGKMRSSLHRLPDILVIHIKRFNMTARWREKIRTKVVFPLSSLDLSEFISDMKTDNSGKNNGVSPSLSPTQQYNHLYDLYAVANHIGGMSGGHYTAFVRCDNLQDDTTSRLENQKWMLFDDEYCEEVSPVRVVSECAYVLFYRRRRLTPSNIINMSI